jgi:hypothetical protein
MSTPIFDQLVAEFAARGKQWETMTTPDRSQPPVFKGARPVVAQLDETMSLRVVKPITVVSLTKRGAAA